MAVAIDTARVALEFIPTLQRALDSVTGGRRRFQILRVSGHATIPFPDSELWRQSHLALHGHGNTDASQPMQEALNWQPDPDGDLGDAAVLHHLHQQAATVPLLSCLNSRSDHRNAATTLTGSALSACTNATTEGSLLSSFDHYSFRRSCLQRNPRRTVPGECLNKLGSASVSSLFPAGQWLPARTISGYELLHYIVHAAPPPDDIVVFWQLQVDVVDLSNRRTLPTSRPRKRRRTTVNSFLQVSASTVVQHPLQDSPERRFNGVRHRPDRKVWVAEIKPPRHQKKQDFGNFKSQVDAARAVDAAFHHYGKPHLLNFPDTSLRFLSTRPVAPPGLDEKGKVKFVRAEAKLLLAAMAVSSPLCSSPANSLQILQSWASPRRCPSGSIRSFSETSRPLSCSVSDEVDDAVWQPQPGIVLDSNSDMFTTGVHTKFETLIVLQNAQQGLDCFDDSSTLASPPNVANYSAREIQSVSPDSIRWSPPALASWRSPSPCHFQDEVVNALLEHQSMDDDILFDKVEDTIGSTDFEQM